jgi:hypothetical protein
MRIRYWLAAAAISLLVPSTASAEEAVEAAIRSWVAALDATPDWSATFGGLIYDGASDTALLTDLVVRAEPTAPAAGTTITLATLSVAGYVEGADGFKVRSVTADGGALEAGFVKLRLAGIGLEDLSVPSSVGFAFDDNKPFTSIMSAYREALKIGLRKGRIGSVELDQTHEGVTSKVVYDDFRIDGFADGKVASFVAGPIRMESPTPDGLINLTIASIESRDTDLGAFVHVYDPQSYVNGVGDMVWRDGLAYAAYNDIVMDVPGAKLGIGSIVLEDFRLRQPPESFVDFFDELILHPNMPDALAERLAKRALPAMFSAFSIGRFAVLDTSVEAMGIDHLAIGDVHMDDFSIDGLGEFGIERVEGVVQGQGAIELDRFAFGGITFGGYEALTALIAAETASPPIDPTELAPRLGFVELLGLDLQTPDIPRLTLERLRADASDYIGPIPTKGAFDVTGLSVPVSAITEPEARDMLRRLGYDQVVSAFGFKANYDQIAQRVTVEDAHYAIADMGSFVMSAALAGLPLSAFDDQKILEALAPQLRLEAARFTFKDDSIVGKGLDLLAGYMNAPVGLFRDQFADAMPFLLSVAVQNDPQLMAIVNKSGLFKQLTPAVRDFVANPGSSITVSLAPPTPIALQAITDAVENTPDRVVNILGLTISAEKGTLPAPGEPAPPAEPEKPGGQMPSVPPTEPVTPPTDGGDGGDGDGGQGMTPSAPGDPDDGGQGQGGATPTTPMNPDDGDQGGTTPSAPAQRSGPNNPDKPGEMRETLNPAG